MNEQIYEDINRSRLNQARIAAYESKWQINQGLLSLC